MSPRWTTDDIPALAGRTALVTGANSGIGFHAARELAAHGARVLLACRNPDKADDALSRLRQAVPTADLLVVPTDLSSLESIQRAAEQVLALDEPLDLLVNNAGVMAVPQGVTADGFETQFGTNHLGHFALTGRLMPALLRAPAPRVVTISSVAHLRGRIDFDDLMGAQGYRRWKAYGQSKLANLLFTAELDRRAPEKLTALAAHPGYAATHLQQGQEQAVVEALMAIGNKIFAQSDEAGAWPTLRAATDPQARGNDFFGPALFGMRGAPERVSRADVVGDPVVAARLWTVSEELTGVTFDL